MRYLGLLLLAGPAVAVAASPEVSRPALNAGGHTAEVVALAFSPDGRELISLSNDQTLRTWDVAGGEPLAVLRLPIASGPSRRLSAFAASPDGQLVAVSDATPDARRGAIYLILLTMERIIRILADEAPATLAMAFSPDGKRLATGDSDRVVRIRDVADGRSLREIRGHDRDIADLVFSPDGERLAIATGEATVRIWSAVTGREQAVLRGHETEVSCLAWSPDGRRVVTADLAGSLRFWEPEGTFRKEVRIAWSVASLSFGADPRTLLVTRQADTAIPTALPWAPIAALPALPLIAPPAPAPAPAAPVVESAIEPGSGDSPVGTVREDPVPLLGLARASGGEMRLVDAMLIDAETGRGRVSFSRHRGSRNIGALSPDAVLAATTGGEDNEILVWKVIDGAVTRRLVGRGRHTWSPGWSPDGKSVVWWTSAARESDPDQVSPEQHTFHLEELALGRGRSAVFAGDLVQITRPSEMSLEGTVLRHAWPGERFRVTKVEGKRARVIDATVAEERSVVVGDATVRYTEKIAAPGFAPVVGLYGWSRVPTIPPDVELPEELRAAPGAVASPLAVVPQAPTKVAPMQLPAPERTSEGAPAPPPAPQDSTERAPAPPPAPQAPPEAPAAPQRSSEPAPSPPPAPQASFLALPSPQAPAIPDPSTAKEGWIALVDVVRVDEVNRYAQADRGSMSLWPLPWGDVAVRRANKTLRVLSRGKHGDRFVGWSTLLGGDFAALGGAFGLELFDIRTGLKVRDLRGHEGHLAGLAPSPDNQYLVSAGHDQTLRIWTSDRDEPLLSLFVAGDDWVAWTPEGYYAASPGGERLMGWTVRGGPGSLATFQPASQFHKSLYHPDVVKHLLKEGSVELALKSAGVRPTDVERSSPPVVFIIAPHSSGVHLDVPELTVRAVAKGQVGRPVTSMRLFVDGLEFEAAEGRRDVGPERAAAAEVREQWFVRLTPGTHQLTVRADSAVSNGISDPVQVTYDMPERVAQRLFVLAVGISDYSSRRLTFAAKDAVDLEAALKTSAAGVFDKVETRLLTDRDATHENIVNGLGWLRRRMGDRDVGVFFYAGHGDDDEGTFYLIPVDADFANLAVRGLGGSQFRDLLAKIKGRIVVMLDTCHAGAIVGGRRTRGLAPIDDLVRTLVLEDGGVAVMCSSNAREYSREDPAIHQGFFTHAVVKGLRGGADRNFDKKISLNELDTYVSELVPELSKERQHPVTAKNGDIGRVVLAQP